MLIYTADQSYYCMYIFHFISLLFQSLETQWGHYVIVSLTLSSPVYRSPNPDACGVPFQVWEGAVVSKRLQTIIPNKKNRRTQSRSSQNGGIMFTSCRAVISLSSCKCKKRNKMPFLYQQVKQFPLTPEAQARMRGHIAFLDECFQASKKKSLLRYWWLFQWLKQLLQMIQQTKRELN